MATQSPHMVKPSLSIELDSSEELDDSWLDKISIDHIGLAIDFESIDPEIDLDSVELRDLLSDIPLERQVVIKPSKSIVASTSTPSDIDFSSRFATICCN